MTGNTVEIQNSQLYEKCLEQTVVSESQQNCCKFPLKPF